MVVFNFVLAATLARLVAAWPEPTAALPLDQRAVDCSKVTGALSILKKLGPPATTFCCSYLKVPATRTLTTTVTPATRTSTFSTSTITVTSQSCGQVKRNEPDVGIAKPTIAVVNLDTRTDVFPLLAAFAAAKISEGCSCLALQPKATTTTTFTAATPITTVVATSTQCVVAQPVCKPNGFGNTCTQNTQCCSGSCGATFDNTICCNPVGQYCNLNSPDECCSGTCLNTGDPTDLDGTCI